jgi:hypothetical protein
MSDKPYITERTKLWRSRDVKPTVLEAIGVIEEFGCQILHITADNICPSYSYSTGVFDNCGKPEIIAVGLKSGTAQHAINQAVRLMRGGIDLMKGRHSDIIGNVEVEFRSVHPRWLHHIMLRTDWFYDGEDVPVLQLVYPDLENRFEGEDDFDDFFSQPNLSLPEDEAHGSVEHDLWAAYDEESSLSRWKFVDGPHTNAYLSETINTKEEPVTYVSHDRDGDWQFLGDKMADGGGPVLSCLHHPIDNDRSLEELHDLPLGWYATRATSESPWERFEHPNEEEANAEPSPDPLLN